MTENFPNLIREKVMQDQEAQRVPKMYTPRHIIIKMAKFKDKERIFFFNVFIFRERVRERE